VLLPGPAAAGFLPHGREDGRLDQSLKQMLASGRSGGQAATRASVSSSSPPLERATRGAETRHWRKRATGSPATGRIGPAGLAAHDQHLRWTDSLKVRRCATPPAEQMRLAIWPVLGVAEQILLAKVARTAAAAGPRQ